MISYRLVVQRGDPSRPGRVLAFPALIFSWFAVAAVVVVGAGLMLLTGITLLGMLAGTHPDWRSLGGDVRGLLPIPIGLAACALYYAACIAGTHASAVLVAAWSQPHPDPDSQAIDTYHDTPGNFPVESRRSSTWSGRTW
jgi:hypothetical protein